MSKQLHPLWNEKHRAYMQKALRSTVSVAHGAVRAGKTIDNIAVFARLLDLNVADRIHLATGSTVANAKLNIGDANGFGLEHIFRGRCTWSKYKDNDALKIYINNREYIVIFAGGGKADSFKKIRGNSYGLWIATEINLHAENFIQEAFNRQLAAKTRKILWDLNPSSPAHWIYTDYIDTFADIYGDKYNYENFTIRDNASITPERLEEAERQYVPGSIWYRRNILGERCQAEGLVYPQYDNTLTEAPETEGDYFVSCDYGIQNPTVFLLWRKIKDEKAYACLDEYYYSGRKEQKQKTDGELADDLQHWLGEMGDIRPASIIVDPSASSLIAELHKRGYKTQKANNDVASGISETAQCLTEQVLQFAPRCKNTIREFGIYMWSDSAADKGYDAPVKQNDHCMDAVRYFVKTRHLLNWSRQRNDIKNLYLL